MTARLDPAQRRERLVEATLAVMVRKGLAGTTVRDVAAEMGTSSGLVHHYVTSMDELLAEAFERAAAQGIEQTRLAMAAAPDPVARLRAFFDTYTRAEQDWAFQLWLDAWAEAARRPVVQAVSRRLNVAWQRLLAETATDGVATGVFRCEDPAATAWRVLSLLDGLALQTVVHEAAVDRTSVLAWSMAYAEQELGLAPGTLD